jgi:hypothetical protein
MATDATHLSTSRLTSLSLRRAAEAAESAREDAERQRNAKMGDVKGAWVREQERVMLGFAGGGRGGGGLAERLKGVRGLQRE